jgi:hypothetical protein
MVQQELLDRLEIMERMVAEGRSDTTYWGWMFILWGAGHAAAAIWAVKTGLSALPWAVLMPLCGLLSGLGAAYVSRRESRRVTTLGRALAGLWGALGISMFLFGVLGGVYIGVLPRLVVAGFCIFLGLANAASGHLLRWWPQRVIGIFFWGCAVVASVAPSREMVFWTFMVSVLVGEVAFGLFLTILERQHRARRLGEA